MLETCRVVYDAQLGALRLNAVHAKKRYDLKRDVVAAFAPGDLVLLIRGEVMDHSPFPKASIPTDGPFTVSRRLAHDRYVLTDMRNRRIHNVVHVSRLVLYPAPRDDDPGWMVSDPQTGGTWPVHSIVDRRRPQNASTAEGTATDFEYRLRFSGFGKKYDKWLHRRYLSTLTPLINHYEESKGLAPPPLPRAVDYDSSQPAVDPALARVPRFARHAPAASAPPPLLPAPPPTDLPQLPSLSSALPSSGLPELPPPALACAPGTDLPLATAPSNTQTYDAPIGPELPDTSDRFPVGSAVDVHYPLMETWYSGVVVGSRVTRPRTVGKFPERRITVQYDAPYEDELIEHGLTGSNVRLRPAPTSTTVDACATRIARVALLLLHGRQTEPRPHASEAARV